MTRLFSLLSILVFVWSGIGVQELQSYSSSPASGSVPSFGVFMVVPPASELPAHVQALKASKVQWIGFDIPLSRINPGEGVYYWNYQNFETTLRILKAAGFRITLKFLGQADWISRDPSGPHADWDETLNLTPPADQAKWKNVVRQVVRRYRAYVNTWQIGNEPDGGGYFHGSAQDYMRYLEWTASAIRSVQPSARIVAGELFLGLQPEEGSYGDVLRKLVRRPSLFNVLSVHYPLGPEEHSAPFSDYFQAMQAAGIKKPVWNSEQAASMPCDGLPPGATTHPRTEGGSQLSPIKALGHSVAEGARLVLFFSWNYNDTGFFHRPSLQKELQVMAMQLRGARFTYKLNTGDEDIVVLRFATNTQHVLIGWTEVNGLEARLRLTTSSSVTIVDWQGNVQRIFPSNGQVVVPLGFCPSFIRGRFTGVRLDN